MIDWLTWPFRIIGFLFWYIGALVTANIAVLKDVLTPGQDSAPGIGLFESRSETEFEFSLISVLITLTPGTLSLGTTTRGEGEPRKPMFTACIHLMPMRCGRNSKTWRIEC